MIHDQYEDSSPLFDVQKCTVCGCTDDCACPGGCSWVADEVCSRCADKMLEALCEDCIRNAFAKVVPYCQHCLSRNCEGSCEQELNPDEAPCNVWECAYKEQCLSALIAGYQLRSDLIAASGKEENEFMIEEDEL